MPYVTKENVKQVRDYIKKTYPKYKWSVVRENYSTIAIYLMEGSEQLKPKDGRDNSTINHYYLENSGIEGDDLAMLKDIISIATDGQKIIAPDTDYGDVPNFYITIGLGKWDKPYKVKA